MLGTGMGAMVGLLVVALLVVPVSFGVAARADVKARRLSESRVSDTSSRPLAVVEADGRCDQWRQLATQAWLICGGASLIAVAVVGMLICFG
ncbi:MULTISPECIES: hypothetical protein [unclassified Rhodococcus (in: high G+C Gram-positive bacteria)]|uniref:hypothetical protein n=1 Tax=unclassified Rhodococcus (in: high G+C Gram-positive bacteria) TaxID=192944 RepID=UPI00163A40F7|nr:MULTISPECIES: hypothetical protein [unclassified Rhodococcus (in: high G+C Gram-positive bacteria)]MBC2642020.1 hypothetical protein [Rhodococcus sp. 3A]MBC2893238.1 hypothetical protein [Rhodococcus sp. 4CII]